MKTLLTTLVIVCTVTIAISQEYTATFGKNPTCNRAGGICTMKPNNNASKSANNVSIVQTKDGATIIRVYRQRLTQDQENLIFGEPIRGDTRNNVQFVMHAAIDLPPEIVSATAVTKSKQVQQLEAKTYPTVITDKYIDITIAGKEE